MIRLFALLLTVLTGFSGLVYEVVWQKYLVALLGSQGEATAAVLAIFLGGLAAGYALFGRATRRLLERARQSADRPRLLAFYARVEAGIGLYALLFPALFGLAQKLSLLAPGGHDALAFAFDVLLSALLIGPPAILMGGTIPILTLALAGDIAHATRVHAWIYGANTLGAFAGALAGGFWLVPLLGLDGVVRAMGGVNLAAALAFAALERRATRVSPNPDPSGAATPVAHAAAWSGIALLAGFAMMAIQTTLNRIGALALGSSHLTFAMVVAVFVFCLALGSFAVSALPRIPRALVVGSQWLLVGVLFPLYFWMADAGYWAHAIRVYLGGEDATFLEYQLAIFFAALLVLAVPIGLSGALLPLLFHHLRREVRDLGAVAGRLYAWNTVGSLLGALLGGYLLLLWLDLHHVFRIAMACLATAASILSVLVMDRIPRAVSAIGVVAIVAIVMLPAWPVDRLALGTFRSRGWQPSSYLGPDEFYASRFVPDVVFYDDDPTSSVSIGVSPVDPSNVVLNVNGKTDGSLAGDYPTMALTGLIPALMAEQHARCFVIGLGTGVTAGELAALEETQTVTVAEISRAVIAGNSLFSAGNQGASSNPKVEIVRGDAYRTLLRSDDRYDVIVSEPSNPWVAGVEMLYTREFLEAARSRLAAGGVYGQWFHVYETDREVVDLILRTYVDVFPHVSVWFMTGPDLLLLGSESAERVLDARALESRFRRPDFSAAFLRIEIDRLPQLLAHELIPLGTLHAEALAGPLHTLRHPLLSDHAARAFFAGGPPARIGPYVSPSQQQASVENSLLRRYAGGSPVLPEALYEVAARETCRFRRVRNCASYVARWSIDYPDSDLWRAALSTLRKSTRSGRSDLAWQRLEWLRGFYRGHGFPSAAGPPTEIDVRRATNLFLAYYDHVVPFDRRAIEEIQSHCDGAGCGLGQETSDDLLGEADGDAD